MVDRSKGVAVQVAVVVVLGKVGGVVSDEKGVVTEPDLRVNVYALNAVRQYHTNREFRAPKFSAPVVDLE